MKKSGFTLIELSIVLVIIGLIVGGVLVGQSLIDAANLRATVSQISSYNTAVLTFRTKYNALPGDIPPTKASQFGLFTITGNCGSACPFGDKLINNGGSPTAVDEFWVFWRHLSEAGLIKENMDSTLLQTSNGNISVAPTGWEIGLMPETKYWSNNYWSSTPYSPRFAPDGTNYETGKNEFSATSGVPPISAHALDSKIDDGMPNTGKMIDYYGPGIGAWGGTPTDGNCTYGGANEYSPDARYILDAANGGNNTYGCSVMFYSDF